MSRASVLARGRRKANAGMVDSCRITKDGAGEATTDEETGAVIEPPRVTVYEGKCSFQLRGQSTSTPEAGDEEWTVQTSLLQLPVVGSEAVRPGHQVEALTVQHDAGMVGRMFTIEAWHAKSYATKRELPILEATS